MAISGIYRILNLITNKFYIGSSCNVEKGRWGQHLRDLRKNKHTNQFLQRAWNKYGEENFRFEVVEECCRELLTEREQFWLDNTRCYEKRVGYNISPFAGRPPNYEGKNNPFYGKKHSEETRKRMRLAAANRSSGSFQGKKHSEESKKKMSTTRKERQLSSGINNPGYGKTAEKALWWGCYGAEHPGSKLTKEQREEICQLYESGCFTHRGLAERFGVSHSTITWTLKRRREGHV